MCTFKTQSAFSTNLKMHLKAHHKVEYLDVMQMELETVNVDNGGAGGGGGGGTNVLRNHLGKRPRKTVEEIQYIIDKCKSNLNKEREKRNLLQDYSAPYNQINNR